MSDFLLGFLFGLIIGVGIMQQTAKPWHRMTKQEKWKHILTIITAFLVAILLAVLVHAWL